MAKIASRHNQDQFHSVIRPKPNLYKMESRAQKSNTPSFTQKLHCWNFKNSIFEFHIFSKFLVFFSPLNHHQYTSYKLLYALELIWNTSITISISHVFKLATWLGQNNWEGFKANYPLQYIPGGPRVIKRSFPPLKVLESKTASSPTRFWPNCLIILVMMIHAWFLSSMTNV